MLPIKNLANTAVADPELPADDAGPHPCSRHLNDLQPDVIWERAAVDKNSPQLINPALPWKQINYNKTTEDWTEMDLLFPPSQLFSRLGTEHKGQVADTEKPGVDVDIRAGVGYLLWFSLIQILF